jgi:hypothetical protein
LKKKILIILGKNENKLEKKNLNIFFFFFLHKNYFALKEGNFIGDMRALLEETENSTSIKAEADCELFMISRLDLFLFFKRNPGMFL